jgi:hypothetical protein
VIATYRYSSRATAPPASAITAASVATRLIRAIVAADSHGPLTPVSYVAESGRPSRSALRTAKFRPFSDNWRLASLSLPPSAQEAIPWLD